ncbi:methionyl-tRNA formyltransferase [Subsaximicrobium wynnwilliamsii]|uniref:Methionyl-tRNA formyltransferase n=1 Tax=Subsaximicrobium wynnwilliamsii TaxID=291179 RepID=A0A5C6ZL18_9FLAO|nr:methionyl-tRNA formyltransferase [Subsaximicrobium wynnwilliamsii]TXD83957.1 methionyl-tRNA formyltransferase [Subsaximicrobium wynnwilliamsii]TXD89697.1 methionyl-tRNA formyltransferase [Subsaximicrobium wynnwilliamsii]TXE01682.1 methionyl-tRNA formyltransferase [Subsaximicrobium wynnwilliamsii]
MLRIGVLCSGNLGLDTLSKIVKEQSVSFVLTDNNSSDIIEFCETHNIPYYAGNPRNGKASDFIKTFSVDVIASINYLFLIEADIIQHANLLTFNIHGSLLPKYRGRTPHVWAIINGETKAGITAHVIDAGCDTGKIIHQIEVPIEIEDTGANMLLKYAELYYPLVERVLEDLSSNQLKLITQDEDEASFYGKRTPADGEIDWNWPKETIRNWVRAQAYPYPGAFTFYGRDKIIIDKISFSEEIIDNSQPNGTLVKVKPKTLVKTKNGAVQLETIRPENCTFAEGKLFSNENRY